MKKRLLLICLGVSLSAPASAQSLGDLLRAADRLTSGVSAVTQVPAGSTPIILSANAADDASLKVALDRATASGEPPARALTDARPVVERLLMTLGCATTAKALHSLNGQRLKPETYRTVDDDLHYTAMGVADLNMPHHDRRTCAQVARIAEVNQPAPNALSLRAFYISPSSGEARNTTVSFRHMDGEWMIDKIGWFLNN